MDRGHCRACGATIYWVRMKSGRRNPVNSEPDAERGNILVCDEQIDADLHGVSIDTGVPLQAVDAAVVREQGIQQLWLSHFATCPERAKFRKAKS